MRIHCLENVDKALQFLKEQRVHLENMGSHDIVDGNHRLVLGLIWTIILRFQVGPREASRHWPGLGIVQNGDWRVSGCARRWGTRKPPPRTRLSLQTQHRQSASCAFQSETFLILKVRIQIVPKEVWEG